MYCIAGLKVMHMLLHVESECDVHDITGGSMWRVANNNLMFDIFSSPRKHIPKLDFPRAPSDSPNFQENTGWYPLFKRSKSNMMNLVCFRSNSQLVAWLRLCA